jgi:cytochrome c553
LVAILDAYRAGTRSSTVMGRIVRGFSQDETVAIATWLAAAK